MWTRLLIPCLRDAESLWVPMTPSKAFVQSPRPHPLIVHLPMNSSIGKNIAPSQFNHILHKLSSWGPNCQHQRLFDRHSEKTCASQGKGDLGDTQSVDTMSAWHCEYMTLWAQKMWKNINIYFSSHLPDCRYFFNGSLNWLVVFKEGLSTQIQSSF